MDSTVSLTGQIYERLRTDLLTGYWRPGQKLLMHQLRTRYESGASPLREALNRLTTNGLVQYNDQRGFTAAAASASHLEDLVRTRVDVECLALQRAFENRSTEWEESIVLAFHRLSRTPRSLRDDVYEENPAWEALHRAYHFTLLRACNSDLLLNFCAQLYDQAYRYRQLAASKAHRRRNQLDEHRALLNAIMDDRLEDARAVLAEHYQQTAALYSSPA